MILVFPGLLVLVTTLVIGLNEAAANFVFVSAAVMLFVMAIWSSFTGERTSILPMKA